MANTKTKTAVAKVSEVDPRVRMKEIRAIVADAVKNNVRIDEMEFSEADNTRVLIALQDQLTDTRERHKKATGHVVAQKGVITEAGSIIGLMTAADTLNQRMMGRHSADLQDALRHEREEHMKTAEALQGAFVENQELHDEVVGLNVKLGSALTTLRTVMDDGVL